MSLAGLAVAITGVLFVVRRERTAASWRVARTRPEPDDIIGAWPP
jgi:hypothetical protein